MKNKPSRQVQRAQHAATLSTPQRQRGAAAVFAGAAIAALVMSMFLAINIGTLYFAQRDLQRQAVMAAIAGAGVGSGCRNGGVPGSLAAVTQQVTNSLANNAAGNKGTAILLTGVNGAPAVQLGWVNNFSGQSVIDDSNNKQSVPADGLTHFLPLTKTEGDSHMNAVRVNLSEVLASPFSNPLFPVAPMNLKASATARQQALGSFYLGTTILALNTANSAVLNPLLQGLLCGSTPSSACSGKIGLILGSYSGLVNANISLGNLLGAATAANVGITDLSSLLTTNLTLPQWLGILGTTLSNTVDGTTGQVSSGVAGLITGLAGVADTSGTTFSLGTILNTAGLDLNPAVSGIVGAVPFVDGLDLLAALGEAAQAGPIGPDGKPQVRPITLPVTLSIPGVADVSVYISIGSPPKFAVGPAGMTSAQTAEITLMVRIGAGAVLNALLGTINGVLGALASLAQITLLPPPLNIGIDVNVAPAVANLNQLICPSTGSGNPIVRIGGTTAVTTINVGPFTGAVTAIPTPLSPSNTYSWQLAHIVLNAGLLGSADTALNLGLTSASVGLTPYTLADVNQFILPPSGNPLTYTAYGAPSPPSIPAANPTTENPQTVGSTLDLALNLNTTIQNKSCQGLLCVVGGVLDLVLGAVKTLLNLLLVLVNGLVNSLIDPLLNLLGIQVGSATVTVDSAVVAPPVVVTTALPGS